MILIKTGIRSMEKTKEFVIYKINNIFYDNCKKDEILFDLHL